MWWIFGSADDHVSDNLKSIEHSLRKILFVLTRPGKLSKSFEREDAMDIHYYAIGLPGRATDDTVKRELIVTIDGVETVPRHDELPEGSEVDMSIRVPNADGMSVVLGFPQDSIVDVALYNVDEGGRRSLNPSTIAGWQIVDNNPPQDPGAMSIAFVREANEPETNEPDAKRVKVSLAM